MVVARYQQGQSKVGLEIVHVELKEANDFVARLHRHHKPALSHRFSIGVAQQPQDGGDLLGNLVGVGIVGRPVARLADQRNTLEVTRLCTDGTKNACSFLYSAAARIGRELGYWKIQTYILEDEPGTSLLAAGWTKEADTTGGDWNRKGRVRRTDQPMGKKQRWVKYLKGKK